MNNKIKWLLKKNISFIKPIAKKLVSKNQKKYIYTCLLYTSDAADD